MIDLVFDNFRVRLADAVTLAINNGRKVSASDLSAYCPLGCLPHVRRRRPTPRDVGVVGPAPHQLMAFMRGFDHGVAYEGRYSELGALYRKRFP